MLSRQPCESVFDKVFLQDSWSMTLQEEAASAPLISVLFFSFCRICALTSLSFLSLLITLKRRIFLFSHDWWQESHFEGLCHLLSWFVYPRIWRLMHPWVFCRQEDYETLTFLVNEANRLTDKKWWWTRSKLIFPKTKSSRSQSLKSCCSLESSEKFRINFFEKLRCAANKPVMKSLSSWSDYILRRFGVSLHFRGKWNHDDDTNFL